MRETASADPDDRDMGETGSGGGITSDPGGDVRAGRSILGSITIARHPAEVAAARRFVAKTLGDHPQADVALLLTSEAVTNSVVHTDGATVTVIVHATTHGLMIEVIDAGAATVPTVHEGCDLREDGRGVLLIRRLSLRSGFHADESGLTYWFEL